MFISRKDSVTARTENDVCQRKKRSVHHGRSHISQSSKHSCIFILEIETNLWTKDLSCFQQEIVFLQGRPRFDVVPKRCFFLRVARTLVCLKSNLMRHDALSNLTSPFAKKKGLLYGLEQTPLLKLKAEAFFLFEEGNLNMETQGSL